jgi:hypothetical protein
MKLAPHGKQVVQRISEVGGLIEFVKLWRVNFIEKNEPKHLPVGWRIDHKFER